MKPVSLAFERTDQFVAAFEAKFIPEPNTGCWLWFGASNKQGYGTMWAGGKCRKAHRISYALYRGAVPEGRDLLHACDTPACVNPDHLTPGTALDNVKDMWRKGRGRPSRGAANGRALLTPDGVQRIHDMWEVGEYDYSTIARHVGISRGTVSRIINGTAWRQQ